MQIDGQNSYIDKATIITRNCFGHINYKNMLISGIMISNMTTSPITLSYQECVICNNLGIFIGQEKNGKPDGFIRFINKFGHIYEGQANSQGANGWGRLIIGQ